MSRSEIRIRRWGDYCATASETPADLKPLLRDIPAATLRRLSRFIQIALVGAQRCVGDAAPAPETAVFFTTGRGDFEVTVEMMQHLLRDGEPPRPLSLINSVSNAACFYVARQLGLHGASLCVGASRFSFETALQLAEVDLRRGAAVQALVGSADIVIPPLAVHRRRLDRPEGDPLGEASHWLWLSAEATVGPVLSAVELFPDRGALTAWAAGQALDGETVFAAGQHLPDGEAEALRTALGLGPILTYREGRPYYDCQAGAVIGAFLSGGRGRTLLHLNRDPQGRWAAILVRRDPRVRGG
jgi:hypothetical protein